MNGLVIHARRIGDALPVEAWRVGECTCGCSGSDGREMLPFDGVVDGAVNVVDAVSPSEGRIVWISEKKRFVMEVTTADGNTEYYSSWKGHSSYQPENFDEKVYYIADKDNTDDWQMFAANKEGGQLVQVSGSGDTPLSLEDIDTICE